MRGIEFLHSTRKFGGNAVRSLACLNEERSVLTVGFIFLRERREGKKVIKGWHSDV